ncbi:MAG: hypothetical protein AAFU80_08905 [Pseudomonadota bacterium]
MIEQIAAHVPESLHTVSGSVFYSGRAAFAEQADVYILGANPGGDPDTQSNETVQNHTDFVLRYAPDLWSAYCDESWAGKPLGQAPLQRRIQFMVSRLGLNPRLVPASNLVFSRSRRLQHIEGDYSQLADLCWPVHAAVLKLLNPRAIVCLGGDCADEVRRRTGARQQLGTFVELNNRRWQSTATLSPAGLIVFQLTHPSVADWTSHEADPSEMVRSVLGSC